VTRANLNLAARDLPPLLASLTPHSLRRTFAMAEMGHTSPALALSIYTQTMRLSDDEREEIGAPVAGAGTVDVVSIDPANRQRIGQTGANQTIWRGGAVTA
jgi:hypothetical protein